MTYSEAHDQLTTRSPLSFSKDEYESLIKQALQENIDQLDNLNHPGSQVVFQEGVTNNKENPKVFFFDIDNCLYKRSTKIFDLMRIYIHNYFVLNLQLDDEEATKLNIKYYNEYGLAIQGLVKHHKINPVDYNKKADDALPLQYILKPDLELREMIIRLRKAQKVDKLWLFTNAYKNHAYRVIRLLGIADLFEGLTYCHYNEGNFICKPDPKMFQLAQRESGAKGFANSYFVDDSAPNIESALKLGLKNSIHLVERDEDLIHKVKDAIVIRDILELEEAVPELF